MPRLYIYIYIYTNIHIYIQIYIYIYMYKLYMCREIYRYLYRYIYIYISVCEYKSWFLGLQFCLRCFANLAMTLFIIAIETHISSNNLRRLEQQTLLSVLTERRSTVAMSNIYIYILYTHIYIYIHIYI